MRLLEGDLIGPGIDHGEQIALLDQLALLEVHLDQLAADLGPQVTVASGVTVPRPSR